MEKILKRIFDFQRFSPNSRLGAIISDVERRYMTLDDDDLSLVAAAGDTDVMNAIQEKNNGHADSNI